MRSRRSWPVILVLVAVSCGSTADIADTTISQPSVDQPPTTTSTTTPPSTRPTSTPPGEPKTLPEPADSAPTDPPATSVGASATDTTSAPFDQALGGSPVDANQVVKLRVESRVADVATDDLRRQVLAVLNDERGWYRAGFTFVSDDTSPFTVILAEGSEVDGLCLPLVTHGTVSCQNGPIVALNATRWREAVDHWDAEVADYRGYLVNHEVGHLLGQRHPKPRCVIAGRPAGVMEQQTANLHGCQGNAWPREWEIELAARRPVVYAPLPDWGPDPVPANGER